MKVAHFNTHTTGGAAIAARRLHEALVQKNVDSVFHFMHGPQPDETYRRVFNGVAGRGRRSIKGRVLNRFALRPQLTGRPEGFEDFSPAWRLYPTRPTWGSWTPGILHLHFIAGFIDYASFFGSLDDEQPIVWTLHDMNAFTGGCHYSWECVRYTSGCSHCPQLSQPGQSDVSQRNAEIKRRALGRKNIHVVASSNWLINEARRSELLSSARSFQKINYGLDTDVFAPRDKASCRQALGIDTDSIVIAFGAAGIDNRRKGFSLVIDALPSLTVERPLTLLLFGNGNAPVESLPGIAVHHLGFVTNPRLLSIIYSAADLFVMPSLYEALGQTCLEAMACGAPVVGFDAGGIPDLVRPGETGVLARSGDAADLARGIEWLILHDQERNAMGQAARALALREYRLQLQADQYLALYDRIAST